MNKGKIILRNWVIAILIFMALPSHSFAQNCIDLEQFITKTAIELKTWKDIYRLFKSYPGCDDGAYAEAYSEFVVHTLARHWDQFGELITLTSTDSNFHNFILNHIDATTDPDDINAVIKNVRKICPSGSNKLCEEIDKAACAALDDLKELGITVGYVPDEETAIKIAVAAWIPIYGKEIIENEKPYKAILKNGIWYVSGSLPKPPDGVVVTGGVAEAEINKKDGKIIRIIHGK